jgi:leucyl-tRNA synthetase
VAAPQASLSASNQYFKSTMSAIGAAEGSAAKKKAKGKTTAYDVKAEKKLSIFVARSFPSWQEKYVDLVRELFDKVSISLDQGAINKRIDPADRKKAFPFVSLLKRRLESGENPEAVLNRKLEFDEVKVLEEMLPVLKSTVYKLKEVSIFVVDEADSKKGVNAATGKSVAELSPVAASAQPGDPSFEFANL